MDMDCKSVLSDIQQKMKQRDLIENITKKLELLKENDIQFIDNYIHFKTYKDSNYCEKKTFDDDFNLIRQYKIDTIFKLKILVHSIDIKQVTKYETCESAEIGTIGFFMEVFKLKKNEAVNLSHFLDDKNTIEKEYEIPDSIKTTK